MEILRTTDRRTCRSSEPTRSICAKSFRAVSPCGQQRVWRQSAEESRKLHVIADEKPAVRSQQAVPESRLKHPPVRRLQGYTRLQGGLAKRRSGPCDDLPGPVPGEHPERLPASEQLPDGESPVRRLDHAVMRCAFSNTVRGHKAAFAVARTRPEELHVLRVELAAQRPGVRVVGEEAAPARPALLLLEEGEQLALLLGGEASQVDVVIHRREPSRGARPRGRRPARRSWCRSSRCARPRVAGARRTPSARAWRSSILWCRS